MIEGLYARVNSMESQRDIAAWQLTDFQVRDVIMGPYRSKLTLSFDGPIPEWLIRALQENSGYVRILP